ncbi:PREDICTED: replication protein A 14 kDa subunit [Corvus brachyrhynchos]|nr:PREDICTED: replication protein A 14 kDa subunit [Corvus brachyrhynchos]
MAPAAYSFFSPQGISLLLLPIRVVSPIAQVVKTCAVMLKSQVSAPMMYEGEAVVEQFKMQFYLHPKCATTRSKINLMCKILQIALIHPSGKLVVLSDGLGKHTTVELSEPLDEEISGVIEVVGRVTNQATIMCASYVQFREDKSLFDLELYNEALKIIHEFPEYFPFGTGRNT